MIGHSEHFFSMYSPCGSLSLSRSSYPSFVGSAFMLGRALTSIFWGLVADRHGRKPVILISIISVLVLPDSIFIFYYQISGILQWLQNVFLCFLYLIN